MDCDEARAAMSALLADDRAPGVDRRALADHLGSCSTCAWPASVVGSPLQRGTPPPPNGPPTDQPPKRPATRRRRRRSNGRGYLYAVIVMAVGLVVGVGIYLNSGGKTPPPLTLPVGPGGATGPLNGSWSVGPGSAAEYRVEEILFDHHNLAVGRTSQVTGTMTIAGATVTSGHFTVDMASVKTGNAGRDTVYRDHLLDTSSHPDGTFTLTRPIDMDTVPADGAQVTERATGKLELRGVSRPVTFPLQVERKGTALDVAGSLTIDFRKWHVPDPSFAITKVGSNGTIGLLLKFSRSGS